MHIKQKDTKSMDEHTRDGAIHYQFLMVSVREHRSLHASDTRGIAFQVAFPVSCYCNACMLILRQTEDRKMGGNTVTTRPLPPIQTKSKLSDTAIRAVTHQL